MRSPEAPMIGTIAVDHTTVPLDVLERFAFHDRQLPEALRCARSLPGVEEVVILSTCNRAEIYISSCSPDAATHEVSGWISDFHGIDRSDVAATCTTRIGAAATVHLFAVAAGIESMVLGEPQILEQVRDALQASEDAGVSGPLMRRLFQRAIDAGQKAREASGIACDEGVIAKAQLRIMEERFGSVRGRRVLIVGAGRMGRLTATLLQEQHAHVLITSRTLSRSQRLASSIGATAVDIVQLPAVIPTVDVLLCSTGSRAPIIDRRMAATAMARRAGRPLLIIDIAVPRDVEPSVGEISGVSLADLKAVKRSVPEDPSVFRAVERARRIVVAEALAFPSEAAVVRTGGTA